MASESEIFALLGRIHVLMRRTLNRITDVDYLRVNKDYARLVADLAQGSGHEELVELAGRLRQAMDLDEAPPPAEAPAPARKYLFTLR